MEMIHKDNINSKHISYDFCNKINHVASCGDKNANCSNFKDAIFSIKTINKGEITMDNFLKNIGFFNFQNQYDKLLYQVKEMAENTSNDNNEHLQNLSSHNKSFNNQQSLIHIDKKSIESQIAGDILAIDIGGTHTKAAYLKEGDDIKDAKFVVDKNNDDFKNISSEKENIRAFIEAIAIKIKETNIDTSRIKGIAIIWSNALLAKRIEGEQYAGISGITTGINEGFYQKGEWFIQGLENGVDIGEIFYEMFSKHQIKPTTLIISNDTIFTQKALDDADAGAVMSSGANGTGVTKDGVICNLESGAQIKLGKDELSGCDRNILENSDMDYSIQYMCAGNWLHRQVKEYILKGSQEGIQDFKELATAIKNGLKIKNEHISQILSGDYPYHDYPYHDYPNAKESLEALCRAIVKRASLAGALILYASVADRLNSETKHSFKFALDSSLAVNIPLFRDTLYEQFCKITGLKKENLVLLEPSVHTNSDGDKVSITVPIMGALKSIKKY